MGAREGEILALDWDHVDFDANKITISGSLGRDGVVGPTKGKKTRVIPLFPEARRTLLELRLAQGQPESGPVFLNECGDRRSVATFQRAWQIARDRAGCSFTFHQATRHNFCSRCAQAGVPLNKVKEWAGHSSLAITERYLHVIEDEADNGRAAQAIVAAF